MSAELEKKDFELHSLRNLLGLQDSEFPFLEKLNAEELYNLKSQVLHTVQSGQKEIFTTMAKVSLYMPNFLNA